MATNRGITVGPDYVTAYLGKKRFTRHWSYADAEVYCPDWTVRRVVGFAKKTVEFNLLDFIFMDPFYRAELILGEPLRTYQLNELVGLVIRRDTLKIQDKGLRRETIEKLKTARTFDEVFDLVPLM